MFSNFHNLWKFPDNKPIAYITHSFFEVVHVYLRFPWEQKGKSPNEC